MAQFRLRNLISGLAAVVPHKSRGDCMAVLFPEVQPSHGVPRHDPMIVVFEKNLDRKKTTAVFAECGKVGGDNVLCLDLRGSQATFRSKSPAGRRLAMDSRHVALGDVNTDLLSGHGGSIVASRAFLEYDSIREVELIRQEAGQTVRRAGTFVFAPRGEVPSDSCGSRALAGGILVESRHGTGKPTLTIRSLSSQRATKVYLVPVPGEKIVDVLLSNHSSVGHAPRNSDEHFVAYYDLLMTAPPMAERPIPKRCGWVSFDPVLYASGSPFVEKSQARDRSMTATILDVKVKIDDIGSSLVGPPLCSKALLNPEDFDLDPQTAMTHELLTDHEEPGSDPAGGGHSGHG